MDEYVKSLAIALSNRMVDHLGINRDSMTESYADDMVEVLDNWLIDYKLEIKYTGKALVEEEDTKSHHLFIDGSCVYCTQRKKIAAKKCPFQKKSHGS